MLNLINQLKIINVYLNLVKKRYKSQLEKGQTPKQSLEEQLKDIEKYAVQTPLSARYVQTC